MRKKGVPVFGARRSGISSLAVRSCTIKIEREVIDFMLIKISEPVSTIPLVPTGSLIMTSNKFGHEMVAGPLVGDQQIVGHKEPGIGFHLEPIDSAAGRYPFSAIQVPVSDYHGALSWSRMEQQFGEPWTPFDNCQHAAREAYYGVPDSPTLNGVAVGVGCLFLLWLASRN